MFELNDVNLVYDLGKEDVTHALKNVNFKFGEKGLVGLIGPSGSGKSSMLYVMAGLKSPTSGEVRYNGALINRMPLDEKAKLRHKRFGFIFQRGYLVEYLSVLDNILVPLNQADSDSRNRALKLLGELGIERLAKKKPYQLSGGQRQRVAIARALINAPEVVFADEPTAALDHKSASEVMKILSDYAKEKLVIVVTHDTSILDETARIVTIWDGAVLDKGQQKTIAGEGQVDAL